MSRVIGSGSTASPRCASSSEPDAGRRVELDHELVGLRAVALEAEPEPRRAAEDQAQLRLRDRHALAGADEERDARPAPVLDLQLERGVRLRRRAVGHARDLEVAVVLAADVVRRVRRGHRAEHAEQRVLQRRVAAGRRLHRRRADHLHQVVDDDVADRADRVVEVAAVLDAEVLGHRDLHAGRRSCGSRPARASCSRTAGRGSRRGPSSRGSGRSGTAATRRCAGGSRRRARAPTSRSWPNGFSTTTRACSVRPAAASPSTTRAEQERRDLEVEDRLLARRRSPPRPARTCRRRRSRRCT